MNDTLLRFERDVLSRRIVARFLQGPHGVRTAESFEEAVKGKTFRNPDTGNKVQFGSLPDGEQKKLRGQWAQKHKEEESKSESKGKEEQGGQTVSKVPKSKPLAKPHEAARVGVGGKEVPPPPKKLPTFSNLREDEKAIESRMNSGFEKNPDGAAKAFLVAVEKDNWVFETDAAKNLLPEWSRPDLPQDEKGKPIHPERAEFRGKYNAVLHQAANAIAKRAFVSRLDDIAKLPEDKRKVLVTSGGVASGKGSALAAQPDLAKSASATWDAAGEQNATENEWVLEECQKRGIRPTFLFVHADPKQSWPGVVERAKGIGRMVDAQLFADSYAVGAKNFNDFHGKHKDKADFVFGVFQGRGQPAKITDKMPAEALKLDAHDVYAFASNYMDEKKDDLPSYIYAGATFGRRTFKESK